MRRIGTSKGLTTPCGVDAPEQLYVDITGEKDHRPIRVDGWVGYSVETRMYLTKQQATELISLLAQAVGQV